MKEVLTIDGRKYATAKWLVSTYGIESTAITDAIRKNYWQTIKNGNKKYIDLSTIGQKTIEKYGISTEAEQFDGEALIHETLGYAINTSYKQYIAVYNATVPNTAIAVELAKAAAVLDAINQRLMPFAEKGIEVQQVMKAVSNLDLKYLQVGRVYKGTKSLGSATGFYAKLKRAKEEGATAVITVATSKIGYSNNRKITPELERLLMGIYINEYNGNALVNQVWRRYNYYRINGMVDANTGEVFEPETLPEIGLTAVKDCFGKAYNKVTAYLAKYGKDAYVNKYRPYVPGSRSSYSLSLVGMDDFDLPFYSIISGAPSYKRVKVVMIFDNATHRIIGYAAGWGNENQMYVEAIKSMLRGDVCPETKGIIPNELQLDNYSRANKPVYETVFPRVNFGLPGNKQGRFAEREILELDSSYLRQQKGWLGLGVRTKKVTSYVERVPLSKATCYTFDEAVGIFLRFAHRYNADKPTISINPALQIIDTQTLAFMAGIRKVNTVSRGFLAFEFNRKKYKYEIPDYANVLKRIENGFKVAFYFLPSELDTPDSKVYVYNFKSEEDATLDTFLCECSPVAHVKRAKIEWSESDGAALGHHLKRGKALDLEVAATIKDLPNIIAADPPEVGTITKEEAEIRIGGYIKDKDEAAQVEIAYHQANDTEDEDEPLFKPKKSRLNPRFM